MEQIKQFLVDNWQFISSAILALLSIIAIVFRRNKNIFVDDSLTSKLVSFIEQAENIFGAGHGKEKKEYVMGLACESFKDASDFLIDYISDRVEELLSLPKKKDRKERS